MTKPAQPVGKSALEPNDLPRHQRARRDRIVQAALELLETAEFERIQIRDVAVRADVALATVYRYFTSKEHLYAAALLEWSKTDRLRPVAGRDDLPSDADRLRHLLLRAVRAFERWPQMLRAEMVLENSSDPNARALFHEFAERHIVVLTAAVVDAPAGDVDAIVETTYSVLAARLRSWARGRCTIKEVERSVSRAVDLVLPG
jgi:TetR/AcrR family transcriptional regulator, cholesterol catabolism regulator